MDGELTDQLWPHFAPLWSDFRKIGPDIFLAGGYGLFLKQQWLLSQTEDKIRTVVTVSDWRDQSPRVTKDLDLIVELDLIASAPIQGALIKSLDEHKFKEVPENARWQFQKDLGAGKSVVLEFHAPVPSESRTDIRVERRRVKPNPSLGQKGIHGRENPYAIACKIHPFSFSINGIEIIVPHPSNMVVMKMAAMRDRHKISQDSGKSREEREFAEREARKHAHDIYRSVAMTTSGEDNRVADVLHLARGTELFVDISSIRKQFFEDENCWGTQINSQMWPEDQDHEIRTLLKAWFS